MDAGLIVIIVISSVALVAFLLFIYFWYMHPSWRYKLNMNSVPNPATASRLHAKWEKSYIEQTAEDIKFSETDKELKRSTPNTLFHKTMFDSINIDL